MDAASQVKDLLEGEGFRRLTLSRTPVGHLTLVGRVDDRPIDVVVDTGAGSTFLELGYCKEAGIATTETSHPAGNGGRVHTVDGVRLTVGGLPLRMNGLFAIDMTSTNTRLVAKGADPIRACIGQDVLRHHEAVIDYAALALFLRDDPSVTGAGAAAMGDRFASLGFRRFMMARTRVGHLKLEGRLNGRPMDIILDTGASKTFIELTYCQAEGIAVTDTGEAGHGGIVYTLGEAQLTLEGMAIRNDGVFALDLTSTNAGLLKMGLDPIRAVIGQDVLRRHAAVIDYAALALYLKTDPDP